MLNLQDIASQREKTLSDFISGIPGQSVTAGTQMRSKLGGLRDSTFSQIPSLGTPYGIDPAALAESTNIQKRKLAQKTESNISRNQLNASTDSIQKRYETNLRIALQSGQTLEQAVATARQIAQDEANQQFTASENAKKRDVATQKVNISEDFANQGLALEQQYAPQTDYEAAMIRALTGTVGAGLTAYGLNKYYNPTATPLNPGTNIRGQGQTLSQQSGFVPRTLSSYGR